MWNIRNNEKQVALLGVQFRNTLVHLLNALGKLLHFRENRIRALLGFFQARDFIAGLVALRFAMLIFGDQLAPLFIQRAKSLKVKRNIATFRHLREDVQISRK